MDAGGQGEVKGDHTGHDDPVIPSSVKNLLKAVAQQTRMIQIKGNKARDSRDNFACFYFSTTLEPKMRPLTVLVSP